MSVKHLPVDGPNAACSGKAPWPSPLFLRSSRVLSRGRRSVHGDTGATHPTHATAQPTLKMNNGKKVTRARYRLVSVGTVALRRDGRRNEFVCNRIRRENCRSERVSLLRTKKGGYLRGKKTPKIKSRTNYFSLSSKCTHLVRFRTKINEFKHPLTHRKTVLPHNKNW